MQSPGIQSVQRMICYTLLDKRHLATIGKQYATSIVQRSLLGFGMVRPYRRCVKSCNGISAKVGAVEILCLSAHCVIARGRLQLTLCAIALEPGSSPGKLGRPRRLCMQDNGLLAAASEAACTPCAFRGACIRLPRSTILAQGSCLKAPASRSDGLSTMFKLHSPCLGRALARLTARMASG